MNAMNSARIRAVRWSAALSLLMLASPLAWAQGGSGCNNMNGTQVAAQSQVLYEFDTGFEPVTVTLTTNRNPLPPGGSLTWAQVDPADPTQAPVAGTAVTLDTSNPVQATFQTRDFGPDGVTLAFRVNGYCNNLLLASRVATLTIQNRDRPPVVTALASPPEVAPGDSAALSATASDPDGDPITYLWSQVAASGVPAVPPTPANQANTTVQTPAGVGDYTLEYRVVATAGTLSASDSVLVNVTSANLAPFASLSCPPPPGIPEGGLLRLDGSASYDPEGQPLTYTWQVKQKDAGLDFDLGDESGNVVERPAPSLGLDMVGGVEVVMRATDDLGLFTEAECAFLITDATAPVLTLPTIPTLDADSAAGTEVPAYAVSAYDNVEGAIDAASIQCTPAAPHLFALGETTVSCEVADTAGNLGTGSFTVTVADLSPPVLDPPGDWSMQGDALGGGNAAYPIPAATDKVDAQVDVSCVPPPGFFVLGSTPVTCTATDDAGLTAQAGFQVTIYDFIPPTIESVEDRTLEATSPAGAIAYFAPTASDVVGGPRPVTCVPASGSTFPLGNTTVACTAFDGSAHPGHPDGNQASMQFVVGVVDTTAPDLTLPAPITREATSAAGAVAVFTASAEDIVDGSVAVQCVPPSGSTFPLAAAPVKARTTTVECSATDIAGNTAIGTFGVTVQDTTAPTIDPVADIGPLDATSPAGAVAWFDVPATHDDVDGTGVATCSHVSGATFPLGTTEVTCNAVDARGNAATPITFEVTVHYPWAGFFRPIDNLPMSNSVKAGSAVPVKFNLGGNMGLSIFAAGYPRSVPLNCATGEDPIEETVTAGGSSLTYDAAANQYVYVWKTEKMWGGSCRQLQLKLIDGTVHVANFRFNK